MTVVAPEETHLASLALAVARKAHAGQAIDGRDVVEDILRPVAEALTPFGPAAVATGWLRLTLSIEGVHTPQTLLSAGVPRFVVDAVVALSRGGAGQIRNPLSRIVALASNFDDSRFDVVLGPDFRRALLSRRAVLLRGIDEDPRDLAAMIARLDASTASLL